MRLARSASARSPRSAIPTVIEMLEWTGAGGGARLKMLIHHNDKEREYAYGPAGGLEATEIGTFSDSLMSEAKAKGWIVISMRNDWKRIFSFQ
jgi:hypothetical protein